MTQEELKIEVKGAIARGWCSKANEHKEMDADLASSIFAEVWAEVAAFLQNTRQSNSGGKKIQNE